MDILGKLAAIFLAVIVFFTIPLVFMHERAKSAKQLYVMSEVTHFVDSVCNLGEIDRDMLSDFYDALSKTGDINTVKLLHETYEYVYDDASKKYTVVKTFHDEADIVGKHDYKLYRGDYFKVTVLSYDSSYVFGSDDETVSFVYGGTVRYEAF